MQVGVSPSRLLGAEQRETTSYLYDEAGRLVSSTTIRDPDWSDLDRGWVLALIEEQADTCTGCGQPNELCRDPATRGQWGVAKTTCWSCLVVEADADGRAESGRKDRGLYVGSIHNVPAEEVSPWPTAL